MQLYHQTGNRYNWNIESFLRDNAGDGLILSPINITYDKLKNLDQSIREQSFFDPQLFLPSNGRKGLLTYPYFPASILDSFSSSDFKSIKAEVAKRHVDLLNDLSFKDLIIPNRYSEIESSDYFEQVYENFIKPHCDQIPAGSSMNKYLTVIVNKTRLLDDEARDSMLDWLTGLVEIDGVYLIFDLRRTSKQIKEPDVLAEALFFIHVLKVAGKKVIIAFTNTEGILFSIANPDAISCGSYENLRNFEMTIKGRFTPQEKGKRRGPNARLYSAKLFQWIEYTFIAAMKSLYPNFDTIFANSDYKPLMFEPTFNWNFQKPELYKHYFVEYSKQVRELPFDLDERKSFLKRKIIDAIAIYDDMAYHRILLNDDSNGSHLIQWTNAISMFEKIKEMRL
jgi:hypothetical protein